MNGLVLFEEGVGGMMRTFSGEILLDDPRWVVVHTDDGRTHHLNPDRVVEIDEAPANPERNHW
jgi:hypothetical protein